MVSPVYEGWVCPICGAEGYTNALVYCDTCSENAIHRYCLRVMPRSFDEHVVWNCEDCEPSPPYHFTSPSHDPSPPQDEDPSSLAPVRTTPSPPYHFTSPTHDPSPPDEDPPSLALVRTTRPRTKRHNKVKHVSSETSEKDNESVSPFKRFNRCIVLGLTNLEPKSLQLQETVLASLEPAKPTKSQQSIEPPSDADSRANQITPKSAELDTSCFLTKGIVKRKRDTARVAVKPNKLKIKRSIEHSSCESSCTNAALKNGEDITHTEDGLTCGPDQDKVVSKSVSFENESTGCAYASQSDYLENVDQVARPRLETSWRGSFNITETDYDVFEGLRGHCSTKVGKKVYGEATTLPSLLSFEMRSKAHLWPKSFMDSPPSDEKIAMYFFPGDTKNEQDFAQLVNDMIDKDLAMKGDSRNAELLIFTSKVLPQEYWRFKGNYYLWGVFKTKKNDVPVVNHSENGNEALSDEEETRKTIESHSPQSPLCTYR